MRDAPVIGSRILLRLGARAGIVAILLLAATAFAQSTGGDYALDRHVIAGGGGASAGGDYVLRGTIAQPEAHAASVGGSFALSGGFWIAGEAAPVEDALFANGFE